MLGLLGISPSHKVHTQLCTCCFSIWNILLSDICMVYSLTSFRSLSKYCLLTETIPSLLFKFAHMYCTVFLHPSPFILFIVISRKIALYYISSFLLSSMRGRTFNKYLWGSWMDGSVMDEWMDRVMDKEMNRWSSW